MVKPAKPNCTCDYCNNPELTERLEAEALQIFGWYFHIIIDATDCPNCTNFHTHGLPHSFNHPDLQICIPMPDHYAENLFWSCVKLIRAGRRFEVETFYDDIFPPYKIQFIDAAEGIDKRHVLRMILPDKNNEYKASPIYLHQFL